MTCVVALMASHNRRNQTLACLRSLYACARDPGTQLDVVLVDDGSADGTGELVRTEFPEVTVVQGSGSLYWNGAMRTAYAAAQHLPYDYLLWLNDDTLLNQGALSTLLRAESDCRARLSRAVIVCGATNNGRDTVPTYGGLIRRSRWRRTRFSRISPGEEPLECETMNGNCVLIPKQIAVSVGNLDECFVHGMGDLDYGLRARAQGFSVWLMPGYAGICVNDKPVRGSFEDIYLPLSVRLERIRSPKGLPLRAWRAFTKRHCGPLWAVFWLWPYVKVIIGVLRGAPTKLYRMTSWSNRRTRN